MFRLTVIGFVLLNTALATFGYSADLKIENIETTVLFPNQQPLRQVALLHVVNSGNRAIRCRSVIEMPGVDTDQDEEHDLPPGASVLRILGVC